MCSIFHILPMWFWPSVYYPDKFDFSHLQMWFWPNYHLHGVHLSLLSTWSWPSNYHPFWPFNYHPHKVFIFHFYQRDPDFVIITQSDLLMITLIRSIFYFYQRDPDLLIHPDKVRLFPFNRPYHDLIYYVPWHGLSVSPLWPSVSHHHDSIHISPLPTWPSISHHRDSIHLSPLPTWPSISHHPGNIHLSP